MEYIPSINNYYLGPDGSFRLKGVWSKRIKRFALTLILSMSLVTANVEFQDAAGVESVGSDGSELKFSGEFTSLIDYVSKRTDPDLAIEIVQSATKWAGEFNIDPKLIVAIIEVESTFNRNAISSAGAFGLMQVIPRWHLDKMKDAIGVTGTPEPFHIETNIYLGTRVISDCLRTHSINNALRCYNGSLGMQTTYDVKVLSSYERIQKKVLSDT